MSFRYIGSKARLTGALTPFIEQVDGGTGRFVDAFSGTGAMAELAAEMGWPVWVNDALHSAVIMSAARLTSRSEASFTSLGGYHRVIEKLNRLKPMQGFIWSSYSPASLRHGSPVERRYFTEENAGRIDAVRRQIGEWEDEEKITSVESRLLLGDLISAVNRAANIAGTYGCFLSKWQASSFEPLALRPRALKAVAVEVKHTVADVYDLQVRPDDVVYLDPPYTKRQYASYYHILETVVIGDEPLVEGVSGLRPWKHKASPFCYKSKALDALCRLITGLDSRTVLLSYSSEGHVDLEALTKILGATGKVQCVALETLARYRPNKTASLNGEKVTEYMLTYQGTEPPFGRVRSPKEALVFPMERIAA